MSEQQAVELSHQKGNNNVSYSGNYLQKSNEVDSFLLISKQAKKRMWNSSREFMNGIKT